MALSMMTQHTREGCFGSPEAFTPLPRFGSLHGTVMICRSYFQVEIELQVQPRIKRREGCGPSFAAGKIISRLRRPDEHFEKVSHSFRRNPRPCRPSHNRL